MFVNAFNMYEDISSHILLHWYTATLESHTALYVISYSAATYVFSHCYICVLILLHMCPHTTIYVCVLILIYHDVSSYCFQVKYMRPHRPHPGSP
jgi:hypothetical protein